MDRELTEAEKSDLRMFERLVSDGHSIVGAVQIIQILGNNTADPAFYDWLLS